MLNIVLPIAGRGSRFAVAGYEQPKPLIPVHGAPMIAAVVRNVRPRCAHRFIFVALAEHLERDGMREALTAAAPGCVIVPVEHVTEGAACTVLLAKQHIDTDDALMLANSDQWVDIEIDDYLASMDRQRADGLIMTMQADDPKWSFVGLDRKRLVTRVVEKEVISNEATVGIYNFRRGCVVCCRRRFDCQQGDTDRRRRRTSGLRKRCVAWWESSCHGHRRSGHSRAEFPWHTWPSVIAACSFPSR